MLRIKKRDPKLRIHPNAANESAKNENWLVIRYSLLVIGLFVFLFPLSSFAIDITPGLPQLAEGTVTEAGPGAFVVAFYRYALMLGGILAFGAIVYGGVKVTLAQGNPASISDAKEWIKSALLGLLLLVGAFLILNTISPGLTTLNLPELKPIQGPSTSTSS